MSKNELLQELCESRRKNSELTKAVAGLMAQNESMLRDKMTTEAEQARMASELTTAYAELELAAEQLDSAECQLEQLFSLQEQDAEERADILTELGEAQGQRAETAQVRQDYLGVRLLFGTLHGFASNHDCCAPAMPDEDLSSTELLDVRPSSA